MDLNFRWTKLSRFRGLAAIRESPLRARKFGRLLGRSSEPDYEREVKTFSTKPSRDVGMVPSESAVEYISICTC